MCTGKALNWWSLRSLLSSFLWFGDMSISTSQFLQDGKKMLPEGDCYWYSKTHSEQLDETEKAFHWEMERNVCIICLFQKKISHYSSCLNKKTKTTFTIFQGEGSQLSPPLCTTLWSELACSLQSHFINASFWRWTQLCLLWKWYFAVYVIKWSRLGIQARNIKEQSTAAWLSHKRIFMKDWNKRKDGQHRTNLLTITVPSEDYLKRLIK